MLQSDDLFGQNSHGAFHGRGKIGVLLFLFNQCIVPFLGIGKALVLFFCRVTGIEQSRFHRKNILHIRVHERLDLQTVRAYSASSVTLGGLSGSAVEDRCNFKGY